MGQTPSKAEDVQEQNRALRERVAELEEKLSRLEAKAREHDLYRQIFHTNQAIKLITDSRTGRIQDANQAACRFYGYSRQELTGMTVFALNTLPEETIRKNLDSAARGHVLHFITPHKLASGEIRHVEVFTGPFLTEGRILLYSIIHDVTRRVEMESNLRESREKYKNLFDTVPVGISITDQNYKLLEVNLESEFILGLTRDEQKPRFNDPAVWKVLRPDGTRMPAGEIREFLDRMSREEVRGMEVGVIRPDRQVAWILLNSRPMDLPGLGLILAYKDITARRRTEEALVEAKLRLEESLRDRSARLRQSSQEFHTLVDNLPLGFWAMDSEGRCTMQNQASREMWGDMVGRALDQVPLPQGWKGWNGMDTDRALEGRVLRGEFQMPLSAGNRVLEYVVAPVRVEGRVVGILGVALDVTERSRAQEESRNMARELEARVKERTGELALVNQRLQEKITELENTRESLLESRERFSQLAENIHEVFWLVEADDPPRLLYVNRACEDVWGIPRREVLADPDAVYRYIVPEDKERARTALEAFLSGRAPLDMEIRVNTAKRGLAWARTRGMAVETVSGQIRRYAGLVQDITQEKRHQELLRQMAAGIAHNFNNVLMAISSNAQAARGLWEAGRFDREMGELLDNVVAGAGSGKEVVRRMHNYLALGKESPPPPQIVDLAQVVFSGVGIARTHLSSAHSPAISLELSLGSGLNVLGRRGELMEVVLNLIRNAVESMPGGGKVRLEGETRGGWAHLRVMDQGPGVPPANRQRIFEPFFSTKEATGRGLGLASSLSIVQGHGGSLQYSDRSGGGAVFTLSLPLSTRPPAADLPSLGVGDQTPLDLLLVEDEVIVAMGTAALLSQAGHQVRQAHSLGAARRCIGERRPGLILCDLDLNDGTAWDLALWLEEGRKAGEGPPPPMVIITGYSRRESLAKMPQGLAPPLDILQKPLDRSDLLAVVARAGHGAKPLRPPGGGAG